MNLPPWSAQVNFSGAAVSRKDNCRTVTKVPKFARADDGRFSMCGACRGMNLCPPSRVVCLCISVQEVSRFFRRSHTGYSSDRQDLAGRLGNGWNCNPPNEEVLLGPTRGRLGTPKIRDRRE